MRFAIVLLAAMVAAVFAGDDKYTTKYDSIDIDAILANERLTGNYVKCLLDTGKCNEDGQTLKNVIPDALQTKCSKCNEHQKETVKKVAKYLYKNRRADWDALVKKYDGDGKYRDNFKSYVEELES